MMGSAEDGCNFLGWSTQDKKAAIKKLDADVMDLFLKNKQDELTFITKQSIFNLVSEQLNSETLAEQFLECGLRLNRIVQFGSSNTDLATNYGDIDVSIILEPTTPEHKRKPMTFLMMIHNLIKTQQIVLSHTYLKLVQAKVPIIQLVIDTFHVDVSIHIGKTPPTNYIATRVFTAYERFEPRLVPLCGFIKVWFKNVQKTYGKELAVFARVLPNSYATNMMVVFFLRSVGLLPDVVSKYQNYLHPSSVTWETLDMNFEVPKEDVDSFSQKRENREQLDVGELLIMFINFYSNIVDLQANALNLNEGLIEDKLKPNKKLQIVDRFDPFNPGRSVRDVNVISTLLSKAVDILRSQIDEDGLMEKLMSITISDVKIEEEQVVKKEKKANQWAQNRLARRAQRNSGFMPQPLAPIPFYGQPPFPPPPHLGNGPYYWASWPPLPMPPHAFNVPTRNFRPPPNNPR